MAITNTVPLTNTDHDEIKAILSEYRISNADVAIREPNATADDLVDVIEGNRYMVLIFFGGDDAEIYDRVYIPAIYVGILRSFDSRIYSHSVFQVLNKVSTQLHVFPFAITKTKQ